MLNPAIAAAIDRWVAENRDRIVDVVRRLVRVESETHPPAGNEAAAQSTLRDICAENGLEAELYDVGDVPGLDSHPLRNPRVQCAGRPNVAIRRPGRRPDGARSLILSGHMDTVPAGDPAEWTHQPTSGHIDNGRLYGRGAYDMKAGVAANTAVAMLLNELGIELDGDLVVESVADEEFAGGHGTIAARLHSGRADAVLIPEPSNLSLYRAHRGLRLAQVFLRGKGGVTFAGDDLAPPVHSLPDLIQGLVRFGTERNAALDVPESYRHTETPANWMITKVRANDWRDDARLAVPDEASVEFFWETMPGETQAQVEAEFEAWLEAFRRTQGGEVSHRYMLRWMEGYELAADHPLTHVAEAQVSSVLGRRTDAVGAPFPCDLFLFARMGVPAGLILGPAGNNAHAADEWVDLDSVMDVVRIYARIACDWCGVEW
jgi:acetylornithine deacetylase